MILGARLAEQLGHSFPDVFKHQYRFYSGKAATPDGWQSKAMDGFVLDHCPDLPVARITDLDDTPIGWALGVALRFRGPPVNDGYQIATRVGDDDFLDVFENNVAFLSGRYVVVLVHQGAARIYGDPVGDLGCVYNTKTGVAASTLTLALDRDIDPNPQISHDSVSGGAEAYSLGHTRDAHVKRLLPNHYLSVADKSLTRFWPKEDTDLYEKRPMKAAELSDAIGQRLGHLTRHLFKAHPCIFPISGGRDSRTVLAAAEKSLKNVKFFFAWSFHHRSRKDVRLGQSIAKQLDLPFRHFRGTDPGPDDLALYELRTGFTGYGDVTRSLAISESMPGGHIMVRGNVMEILRATNWHRQQEGTLNLPHVKNRLRLFGKGFDGDIHKWDPEILAWVDTLPPPALARVYDFVFIEQLLPHAQGARLYGVPQNFVVNPFNDRALLRLSMHVDRDFKLKDQAYDRIVRNYVPELAEIPYN